MSADANEMVRELAENSRVRPRVLNHFAEVRAADPRGTAPAELLDQLAIAGATSDTCRDTLLELLVDHGLARPAIRKFLIDDADVAEVEQRTLVAVSLKLSSFEGRSRFTTWLHTVASNEARMFIRSRSRRRESRVEDEAMFDTPYLARLSTLAGDRDLVARALAELPDGQRDILVLREVDGLEYQEISDLLGVPVGTVRSRLNRARTAMAAAVQQSMN